MNNWRKVGYSVVGLVTIVGLGAIVESCGSVDCDPAPSRFELVSFSSDWVRITGEEPFNDQVDLYQIESYQPTEDGISYDSLAIRTMNNVRSISQASETIGSWFINSAMACTPALEFEPLEDIEIISDADYDASHPAGTDLNDIISIRRDRFKEGLPIPSVISGFQVDTQDLLFTFDSAPTEVSSHNLTITYVMFDGTRLTQSLIEVMIRP